LFLSFKVQDDKDKQKFKIEVITNGNLDVREQIDNLIDIFIEQQPKYNAKYDEQQKLEDLTVLNKAILEQLINIENLMQKKSVLDHLTGNIDIFSEKN
jgi:hypothetical protein